VEGKIMAQSAIEWTEIRANCQTNNIPFFFKQWSGVWKKRSGRTLDGKTWDELPVAIQYS
jgi:protein gp37